MTRRVRGNFDVARHRMAMNIIRFVLLVLMALLVGSMFGILIGYNPASLSASAYGILAFSSIVVAVLSTSNVPTE
jgi:hypothetical protein